jgi:hypothetical protein
MRRGTRYTKLMFLHHMHYVDHVGHSGACRGGGETSPHYFQASVGSVRIL